VRGRIVGALALCAVVLVAGAPPAGAATIGISDQNASAFGHPLFGWSGIRTARVIAPWDAGLRPPAGLAEWLGAARAHGVEPLVTFGNRRGQDCRVVRCYLPSAREMRAAVRAFRARWPHVTTFSTWNEANHPGQPTARRPGTTAGLYEAIVAECPGCTVVAVEVLDIEGMADWLEDFQRALGSSPQLWGLQNYGDVTRDRTTYTDRMMREVPGQVWVTETGGIVRHVGTDGTVRWPFDEERARASVARALALADRHPGRIGRVYLYQWQTGWGDLWDSGLMRPDGTPRPSFHVLAARLRPGVPVPSVVPAPPPAKQPPAKQPPGGAAKGPGRVVVGAARGGGNPPLVFVDAAGRELLRLVRRPWVSRRGVVRARVACPRGRPAPCRARLRVRTRTRRLLARVRGAVPAGETKTLRVRLARADRRRIRRGRLRVLVAELAVAGGPRWRVSLKARPARSAKGPRARSSLKARPVRRSEGPRARSSLKARPVRRSEDPRARSSLKARPVRRSEGPRSRA
jgi:hypothetical protein